MTTDEAIAIDKMRARWAEQERRSMRKLKLVWFFLKVIRPIFTRLSSDEKQLGGETAVLQLHLSLDMTMTMVGCCCLQCCVRRQERTKRNVLVIAKEQEHAC